MQTRVNEIDGETYVWIPPGSFVMVSRPAADDAAVRAQLRSDNAPASLHNLHTEEGPFFVEDWPELSFRPIAHRVNLTRGFWIGQTPVTQEAYERVMGNNPSAFKGAWLPVQGVSWSEAEAYSRAAGMRLPTEAEWEYAARGGDSSLPDGDGPFLKIEELAWHYGNSFTIHPRTGRTSPVPQVVGQKRANGFGLLDMLGNTWEWVADCFWDQREPELSLRRIDELPVEMREDVTDPQRPPRGAARVLRGGSFLSHDVEVSLSCRKIAPLDAREADFGFRCVGDWRES